MSWLELTFEIDQTQAESCCDTLEHLGACAVSFFDAEDQPLLEPLPGTTPLWPKVKMVGLFEPTVCIPTLTQTLKEAYPTLEVTITDLAQREWTRTWLDHFQPMSFGQRLWIVPLGHSFEVENKEAAIVRLDPGLAFGTGTHPTTALCLRWLDAHPLRHLQIVDYGCGSGVLSIAALLLGAQKVFAIDYDPQALWSTRENARRNALTEEQLVTLHPDEISEPIPCSQVILANILAEPLIQLAPRIKECCQIGGVIVLSGLLTTQMDAVKAAYSAWFKFDEPQFKEEWVLLTAKRIV